MRSRSILTRLAEIEAGEGRAVLVTVVRVTGSAPRDPGARMIVFEDRSIEGTIGGGRVEHVAIDRAMTTFEDDRPKLIEHQLTQELGMCCGGSVTLFLEPIGGQPRLIVFGAGHVGTAVTRMASLAGFAVHVVDEREDFLTLERLPDARALYDDVDDPAVPFGDGTYVLIVTHDHALDQRLVEKVLGKPHRWLGMIGSRRKATLFRDRLAVKGFDSEAIASMRSPVGLAIEAQTPEEIAVSILSELVALRRGATFEAASPALETKAKNG